MSRRSRRHAAASDARATNQGTRNRNDDCGVSPAMTTVERQAAMGRVLVVGKSPMVYDILRAHQGLRGHTVERCTGDLDALRRIREHAFDVVVTDPETPISADLVVSREFTALRPGLRMVVLASAASDAELIAALRAHVFGCLVAPYDPNEIVDMVRSALSVTEWRDGIEVVSGLPNWLTLKVSCHIMTADRLVAFMSEREAGVPENERDLLVAAFRELLLNAMEHGAGFDPEKVIEVTAARTARAIVYHFRDPGDGFDVEDLKCAACSTDPEEVLASALRRAELGLRPGGFGMLIARQVADELVYNERHNEVLMIKHLT
jgi:anti-sigma regulatory factor (Ser/Thr protein kinase)/CheY-like chemotaxis protein